MIVSNASPLIYLAKVKKLKLLKNLFGTIHIPAEVKVETVDRGKELGESDALIIEEGIEKDWISVHDVELQDIPIEIDEGEIASISLARELDVEKVLLNEISARNAARIMDLEPRGTIYVLLEALKQKEIDLAGFLDTLENLVKKGFRLKEEVYIKSIRKAREISDEI